MKTGADLRGRGFDIHFYRFKGLRCVKQLITTHFAAPKNLTFDRIFYFFDFGFKIFSFACLITFIFCNDPIAEFTVVGADDSPAGLVADAMHYQTCRQHFFPFVMLTH